MSKDRKQYAGMESGPERSMESRVKNLTQEKRKMRETRNNGTGIQTRGSLREMSRVEARGLIFKMAPDNKMPGLQKI